MVIGTARRGGEGDGQSGGAGAVEVSMRDKRELYGALCYAVYVMMEYVWRCMEHGTRESAGDVIMAIQGLG